MTPKIIAIILAKTISSRLPGKNYLKIAGKEMLCYAVEAAEKSKYINEIYLSSEEEICTECSDKYSFVKRPKALSEGETTKSDVLFEFFDNNEFDDETIVCLVQSNSPQVKYSDIDIAIKKVLENDVNEKIWECQSVDNDTLKTNGAIRVFRKKCLYNHGLAMYLSMICTDYIDIHTEDDYLMVKEIMEKSF